MAYSSDDLQRIATDFEKWQSASRQLAYAFLRRDFRCGETSSIVAHGLVRRLETLRHCMQRTFEHVAPENVEPTRLAMLDATAYLQSFIFNLYGALDNLARIWCREAAVVDNMGRPIADQQMGFTSKNDLVRRSLSAQFRNYLQKHDPWFEYLSNYRHALAHRIPLYIPPRCLAPDEAETWEQLEAQIDEASEKGNFEKYNELSEIQNKLGVFAPWMMHSFGESDRDGRPVYFHSQMIVDLATLVEIGELVLKELDHPQNRGRDFQ